MFPLSNVYSLIAFSEGTKQVSRTTDLQLPTALTLANMASSEAHLVPVRLPRFSGAEYEMTQHWKQDFGRKRAWVAPC